MSLIGTIAKNRNVGLHATSAAASIPAVGIRSRCPMPYVHATRSAAHNGITRNIAQCPATSSGPPSSAAIRESKWGRQCRSQTPRPADSRAATPSSRPSARAGRLPRAAARATGRQSTDRPGWRPVGIGAARSVRRVTILLAMATQPTRIGTTMAGRVQRANASRTLAR